MSSALARARQGHPAQQGASLVFFRDRRYRRTMGGVLAPQRTYLVITPVSEVSLVGEMLFARVKPPLWAVRPRSLTGGAVASVTDGVRVL